MAAAAAGRSMFISISPSRFGVCSLYVTFANNFLYRYTYYESDEDSGSDMEAAGIDVLEEEEKSRRAAVLEDQMQERLEKEMAAKKAALKKKLAAKKK